MTPVVKAVAVALLAIQLPLQSCNGPDANTALGVLARERVSLTATASAIITDLPVSEGESVEPGTVLVRLDDRLAQANLEVAMANRARAQADLDRLEIGARDEEIAIAQTRVEGAQAVYLEANAALERNRQLLDSGSITQASLDQAIARRDSALAELRNAQQVLVEIEAGAREEDIRVAEAQLRAAEAGVAAEQARLEDLTIRASRAGTLDNLPWNLGERVPQGSPIAIILAGDRPFARVYVPEPARAHLAPGDPVRVELDGVDTTFEGTVRWISQNPAYTPYYALNQEQRARLVYLAEITLPPDAEDLPVGMPVTAYLP